MWHRPGRGVCGWVGGEGLVEAGGVAGLYIGLTKESIYGNGGGVAGWEEWLVSRRWLKGRRLLLWRDGPGLGDT